MSEQNDHGGTPPQEWQEPASTTMDPKWPGKVRRRAAISSDEERRLEREFRDGIPTNADLGWPDDLPANPEI